MPRETAEASRTGELERTDKRRQKSPARVVGTLVVVAAAVIILVQNHQDIGIHFLVFTGHVHLVWLLIICLVLGAAAEALVRRLVRLRWRARRGARQR